MKYQYNGKVVDVYDADTMTIEFDLGFNIKYQEQKCRLYGIDTPELRTKNKLEKELGYKARDYVRKLVLNKDIIVETFKGDKKGKFGRYLVDIITDDGRKLNDILIDKGYAKPYFGKTKEKWFN